VVARSGGGCFQLAVDFGLAEEAGEVGAGLGDFQLGVPLSNGWGEEACLAEGGYPGLDCIDFTDGISTCFGELNARVDVVKVILNVVWGSPWVVELD
jgi:hypothetical protein